MRDDEERLEELAESGRLRELLELVTLEDVAEAWWARVLRGRERPRSSADDDEGWWSVAFFMSEAISEDGDLHRAALLTLMDGAPDVPLLSYVVPARSRTSSPTTSRTSCGSRSRRAGTSGSGWRCAARGSTRT